MPVADFKQFRTEVLRDPSLQQSLSGGGSKTEFVTRVVEAGAERGFQFTADDVVEAMRASKAEWVLRWI